MKPVPPVIRVLIGLQRRGNWGESSSSTRLDHPGERRYARLDGRSAGPHQDRRPAAASRARAQRGSDRAASAWAPPPSEPGGRSAGWGKTTLLAEWITVEDELTFAWLTLDAHDNDPARFWSYVAAALRKADVDVPPAFEAAVAAPGTSPATPLCPCSSTRWLSSEQEHILVLDDYHLISEPEIHEGMRFLLQHLPLTSHLVIATRAEPPVDLSRLRARGELGEIVSDQLRFSDAEAAALLNDTLELALPAKELQAFSVQKPRAGLPGSTWPACRCATDRALPSPPTSGTTAISWITSATRCCRRRSRRHAGSSSTRACSTASARGSVTPCAERTRRSACSEKSSKRTSSSCHSTGAVSGFATTTSFAMYSCGSSRTALPGVPA